MERQTVNDRISQAMKRIENEVPKVFQTDEYKKYLQFAAKFHNYSWNNTMLIYSQKPNATFVAGFKAWKDMGNSVLSGEKGIQIFAPMIFKDKFKREKVDELGNKVLDEYGNPVLETEEKKSLGFRIVHVFDISQTDATPPEIVHELCGDDVKADCLVEAIREVAPMRVCFADESTDEVLASNKSTKGYCSFGLGQIVVREGLSGIQTAKTLIHEYAHSMFHNPDNNSDKQTTVRGQKEVEAESTAFVLASHFGLDTSEYSMPYIATWNGADVNVLKDILNNIQTKVHSLIEAIEPVYEQKMKEYLKENRDIDIISDRITAQGEETVNFNKDDRKYAVEAVR